MKYDPLLHHIDLSVDNNWKDCHSGTGNRATQYKVQNGDERGPILKYRAKGSTGGGYKPTTHELAVGFSFSLHYEVNDWPEQCQMIAQGVVSMMKDASEIMNIRDKMLVLADALISEAKKL